MVRDTGLNLGPPAHGLAPGARGGRRGSRKRPLVGDQRVGGPNSLSGQRVGRALRQVLRRDRLRETELEATWRAWGG